MERSLEIWSSHGAHGIGAALAALKEALAVDRSARLSAEEVGRLGQELQRCGNNFRAVAAAMAPHLEATSAASASAAASSSAAASASAATSSLARTLPQLVESYYLDHYLQLGFAQDEMRFASVATLRERSRPLGTGKPRRVPVSALVEVPKTLVEMLASGIVLPGTNVLSTAGRAGRDAFADLLPSGLIRFQPADGGHTQLLRTPAMFVRAAAGTSCANGWRRVRYDGVPLDLLRDAAFDANAALEAVALQASISETGGAPRPSATVAPATTKTPKARAVPSTPSKRAHGSTVRPSQAGIAPYRAPIAPRLPIDAAEYEDDAHDDAHCDAHDDPHDDAHDDARPDTEDELLGTVCELCARADDEPRMLLCDGCGGGYHLYCLSICLSRPTLRVHEADEWWCPGCVARRAEQPSQAGAGLTCRVEPPLPVSPALFEVEAILQKRHSIANPQEAELLVRWRGYSAQHDSWEPRSSLLRQCRALVSAFEEGGRGPKHAKAKARESHKRQREMAAASSEAMSGVIRGNQRRHQRKREMAAGGADVDDDAFHGSLEGRPYHRRASSTEGEAGGHEVTCPAAPSLPASQQYQHQQPPQNQQYQHRERHASDEGGYQHALRGNLQQYQQYQQQLPTPFGAPPVAASSVSSCAPFGNGNGSTGAAAAAAAAAAEILSLAAEKDLEYQACVCRPTCALQPLIVSGRAPAGEGVLSYCYRDVLCFADLAADGSLRTRAADGQALRLASPCLFMLMVQQRMLGAAAAAALKPVHPHKALHYKGVPLDQLRARPRRPSRS